MDKTEIKAPHKTAPATALQKQPEPLEKQAGPSTAAQVMTAALPPPNGKPAPVRAAGILGAPAMTTGAVQRARLTAGMQHAVGNARLSRMMEPAHSLQRSTQPVEGTPAAPPGNLSVVHPADPSEKEAETVARHVTQGKPAPPITPLSASGVRTLPQPQPEEESAVARVAQRQTDPEDPPVQGQFEAQTPGDAPELAESTPIRRQVDEVGDPVQTQARQTEDEQGQRPTQTEATGTALGVDPGAAKSSIAHSGAGNRLSPPLQRRLEQSMGVDLSQTRVHSDDAANQAARALNARAFTQRKDIYLAGGESANDVQLMAHEATHVAQQGQAPMAMAARQPAAPAGAEKEKPAQRQAPAQPGASKAEATPAPGPIELKGQTPIPHSAILAEYLEAQGKRKTGVVQVNFGKFARGPVKVKKKGEDQYAIDGKQAIPITHTLFRRDSEAMAELQPHLILIAGGDGKITGFVGLRAQAKTPDLSDEFKKAPELLGFKGFALTDKVTMTNRLENGALTFALSAGVTLGGAFSGQVSIKADDEKVTEFTGTVTIQARGLASGAMTLTRTADGAITGTGTASLDLTDNFKGELTANWDGETITGVGKAGYQGEKLSGEVTLTLMTLSQAQQLEQQKKAPPEGEAPTAGASGPAKKPGKPEPLALFGEGNLTFAFTDWLNGVAQVIVDYKGHVTIIGKITPQKEFELFPQKDYNKDLFKLEARAAYGIPVVGNIFIFANIGMNAFAKVGPARLHNIVVEGTYSTNPEQNKDFSIRGSLNLSAAAGLRLRGEAGAGLEILSHDIKAGAGINAIAALRGYAEATPIIGYREQGNPGEDKKGQFFIRGELEIAAQPFLGLDGDLFVELDSPWWSPAPDKKWTWPLGGKEWPIGGEFGIGAAVDYVFGSGEAPAIEFKKVDFSADKFLTDLYSDQAKASGQAAAEQAAEWKEKNSKEAAPPTAGTPGEGKAGTAAETPQVESTNKLGGENTKKEAAPTDRTAEGKSVKELQEEATQKGKKPAAKEPLTGTAQEEPTSKAKTKPTDERMDEDQKWERGVAVVKQALAYAEREGIDLDELNRVLKSIKKRKEFGFSELYAEDAGEQWLVRGSMSPGGKPVTKIKKKDIPDGSVERPYPLYWPTSLLETPPVDEKLVRVIGAPRDETEGFQAREKSKLFLFMVEREQPNDTEAIKELRRDLRKQYNIKVEIEPSSTKYHQHHVHPLFLDGKDSEAQMIPVPASQHLAGHKKLQKQVGAPDPPKGMPFDKRDLYDRKKHPDGTHYELKGDI